MKWTEEETKYLIENYGKVPNKVIAQKVGRTTACVKTVARKKGLSRGICKYSADHKYFDIPNGNNSYWAGFISGDGHIRKDDGALMIELGIEDILHLEKFKLCVNFNGVIYDLINTCSLEIHCAKNLGQQLTKNFNIPRGYKSLILNPPINLEGEDSIRAFIRGSYDSDGSIFRNKLGWTISFCGTKELLIWINQQLHKFVPGINNPSVRPESSIYQLSFSGYQSYLIAKWLYNKSDQNHWLTRKHNRYLELCQFYKSGPRTYTSEFVGVSKHKNVRSKPWQAYATVNKKRIYLGYYATPEEAFWARNNYLSS